ncbi:sulfotransferase [Pelagibacterium halotolerans B2]|uniref:Sulfotransferase n=1 Tax=Pelagibacterium halotolerans (strain DSM 22347 / JCM 15775 / CGMCC 1.7692 / B2) TaxID=1082931 RepID=G4RGW1_PELHB|nr:sulfotransferase [Pelagibacterium halotolerans B2]
MPALERISLDMPADSRFLIFVRDPLERAISHYRYLRKIGKTSMSFDDAVSAYPQIVEHSLFGKYVASAVNLLGKERVHVLSFDDLKTDPEKFGEQVSKALDIPFLPGLPYSDRILEAAGSRAPILTRVLREVSWGLRGLGLATFVSRVKQSPLINKILFSTQKLDDREKSTPGAAVKRNLSEIFDRDLEQLGHLVGPNTLQSIKE